MNNLEHWRRKAGISQKELADKSGCSQPYVSQLEQGTRADPGLTIGRKIVRALVAAGVECTLDDVFPPEEQAQGAA